MSVTEVNLIYLLLFPWQGNVGILAVCTEKLGTNECYAVESNQ